MNLQVIAEHTFDVDQLRPGAMVLDVGCRDLRLAKSMIDLGCRVVGLDPDPYMERPDLDGFLFLREALVSRENSRRGTATMYLTDDPYGSYVGTPENPVTTETPTIVTVATTDIERVSRQCLATYWTAVKLDCEGSEYEILLDWPGPIAGQISVEFHDHLHNRDMSDTYDQILRHLGQWYDVHQWQRTGKKLGTKNYWDVLFTLKSP